MRRPTHRAFFTSLAVLALLAALILFLQWPRATAGQDAPATAFSAERALASLADLLERAGGPHPVGTAANARVHDGVVAELEAAGWRVERQRGVGCRGLRTCAAVENLIARLPGQGTGPALLVACHTDSVPAGPGAGDDGAGLATMLEMARNLAAGPPLERPVWLLFDEGEEMGLLGAELFTRRLQPGAVGAVINLEARGTEGPVWLFETSAGGGALIDAYARSVARPSTSSIAYSVYQRMPNDTDLTVFRGAGLAGLGLAFIDGGARYHTPRDDLDHLSPATVQRLGDTALALVRELASGELPVEEGENVFFDVAGLFTVTWPSVLSPLAAALALALLALAARGRVRIGELVLALLAWLLAVVGGFGGGLLVYFLLGLLGALPTSFPANVGMMTAAAVAGALAVAALCARLFRQEATTRLIGGLLGLAALALAVSLLEPAASYPFVLASLAGGLVAVLAGARLLPALAAGPVAAVLLVITLAPLVRMLPVGIGPIGLAVSGLLTGFIAAPILPLLPRHANPLPALAVPALLVAVAALQPQTDASNPLPLSIRAQVVVDPASGEREARALLVGGELPEALEAAAGELGEVPYGRRTVPAAAIADPGGEPVTVRVLRRDGDRLRLHLRSPRAAWGLTLGAPEGTSITGVTWPGLEPRTAEDGARRLRLQAVPAEGVGIELRGELVGELELVDLALGLPPEAEGLARARPEWATPLGLGDLDEVISRVDLETLRGRVEGPSGDVTTDEVDVVLDPDDAEGP